MPEQPEITLEHALAWSDGKDWTPVAKLGKGGSGTVFLCAPLWVRHLAAGTASYGAYTALQITGHPRERFVSKENFAELLRGTLLNFFHHGAQFRALKLIHLRGETDRSRFERELALLQRLGSVPGLAEFHGGGMNGPHPWMLLTAYEGDATKVGPRLAGHPSEACRMMLPAARALAAIHAEQHVHRDIKPANLFLNGDHFVLGDLGICFDMQAEGLTTSAPVHSRDWVPDWVQYEGGDDPTAEVDTYMMVHCLFFLVTGSKVKASQLERDLARLDGTLGSGEEKDRFVALLRRYLVTDRSQCPGSVVGLLEELEEIAFIPARRAALRGLTGACERFKAQHNAETRQAEALEAVVREFWARVTPTWTAPRPDSSETALELFVAFALKPAAEVWALEEALRLPEPVLKALIRLLKHDAGFGRTFLGPLKSVEFLQNQVEGPIEVGAIEADMLEARRFIVASNTWDGPQGSKYYRCSLGNMTKPLAQALR